MSVPNFSSVAGLEVAEKVCTVIFMSNPTVVLCWGWGFDNWGDNKITHGLFLDITSAFDKVWHSGLLAMSN